MCKKQIGLLHPNLNIQDLWIDPDMVEEDEEEDEEEEKEELDTNPLPSRHLSVYFPPFRNGDTITINKIIVFLHIYFSSIAMCLFLLATSSLMNVMKLIR